MFLHLQKLLASLGKKACFRTATETPPTATALPINMPIRAAGFIDDWLFWAKHGEKQQFGKPFPIDMVDKKTVSLFFDDNIDTEEHSEKNIVNHIDLNSEKNLGVYPLIQSRRIFPVDTIKAIEDTSYYIGLVEQALART